MVKKVIRSQNIEFMHIYEIWILFLYLNNDLVWTKRVKLKQIYKIKKKIDCLIFFSKMTFVTGMTKVSKRSPLFIY